MFKKEESKENTIILATLTDRKKRINEIMKVIKHSTENEEKRQKKKKSLKKDIKKGIIRSQTITPRI